MQSQPEKTRDRCIECGLPIPPMPEDASYMELLRDRCFEEIENLLEQNSP